MAAATNLGLRRSLAAVLIIALTLAGLGRAFAAPVPPAPMPPAIPGLNAPICHSGAGEDQGGPERPLPPACCDDCALLAAMLPAPPLLVRPTPIERPAAQAPAGFRPPDTAHRRDQNLPRGPPPA